VAERQFYKELGRRIAARRKVLGITQAVLSERMGTTSRAAIANIEAGRQALSLTQIYDLASALEFTKLSDLIPIVVPKREAAPLPGTSSASPVQAAQIEQLLLGAVAAARSSARKAS
jgi:transcriptional regulator with XRE-family HTH domain